MNTHIRSQISDLLSGEQRSELSCVMLDVLRVLVVNKGTSWKSELIQDLALLNAFKGKPEAINEGKLNEALRKLGEKELVRIEERVRGTMSARGGVKDKLISPVDFLATQNALSKDRVLTAYMVHGK